MTEPSHAIKDLVGDLCPHERPTRSLVGDLEVATNRELQFARTAVHTRRSLLLGECGKPSDEVDP